MHKKALRKYLLCLATFAVTFNVAYLLVRNIDELAILAAPKAGPAVQMPRVRPEMVEQIKSVTVLISNEGFGGIGRGTGVLIKPGQVLTCAHLIQSWDDDLWLYFYDGSLVKGKPVSVDRAKDLAVIALDRPVKVPHVAVFTDVVQDGEPIAIVGNALGAMKWYVSGGVISGRHKGWLLSDAFQIGGNSGGPWINGRGEIVGLAAWGLRGKDDTRTGINGAISTKVIRKYL